MKFIAKEDAIEHQNSKTCTAFEYALDEPKINVAVIKIAGRYPEKGYAVNDICKELAYVVAGSGRLVTGDGEVQLLPGSVVLIEPQEKFYWEGSMEVVMPCVPAWSPEQYQYVE